MSRRKNRKLGNWLSPRAVLSIDRSDGIVFVPGLSGCAISVAIEDVRHSVVGNNFAKYFHQSNDQLDSSIEDALDSSICTSYADSDDIFPVFVQNEEFSPDLDHVDNSGIFNLIGDLVQDF